MAKINRQSRRILHAVWPSLAMGPLNRVCSDMRYHCRKGLQGDGLTPKEREYVYKKVQEIEAINKELQKIYYRLKF